MLKQLFRALWMPGSDARKEASVFGQFKRFPPTGTLDQHLKKLIAEQDGISEDAVTVEYIHEQRERRFYPTTRYNVGSRYGGYSEVGLRFLTLKEFDEIEARVTAAMAQF